MNKYELFRAFQDISPDLIEEAERLTVSNSEYETESAKKHCIFLRTHEEEIMGKHSKLFRTLTGAAAVFAVCSIAAAGYFAIRPQMADQADDTASQIAELPAGISNETNSESTTTELTTTAAPDIPSDFVEETIPPKNETENASVHASGEEKAFAEGEYVTYGAWFVSPDEGTPANEPIKVVNGKKTSLDLNIMLVNFDKQMNGKIPTSIVLVQDGEVIPFSFDQNGTPEIEHSFDMDIPETQYSNILNLSVNAKGDRLNKIVERLSGIDGVQNIERHIYPSDTNLAELYVTLSSDLITNNENLYAELYEKIEKIYGINQIRREPVSVMHSDDGSTEYVTGLYPSTMETIWFTPHCRSEYSTLYAAITFYYKNTNYDGDGNMMSTACIPLQCSNPDTDSDFASVCTVASAEDYIDFPEGIYISGCAGIGIGTKQSYGSDAGPHKYLIQHDWYDEPERIGRDEIYLKAHFDPRETFGPDGDQFTMPKNAYALLLCDNKPMGLADGKDVVYLDIDTSKTLNFKLTVDDSIPDGVHDFSVVIVSAYEFGAADNLGYFEYMDSCRIDIQS
ncbi:MAG: hypothetical protein J6Z40_01400 [Oscillospiraceae bacterium]|nr:hypothetical protein [Oscillospiraceae bacterium]